MTRKEQLDNFLQEVDATIHFSSGYKAIKGRVILSLASSKSKTFIVFEMYEKKELKNFDIFIPAENKTMKTEDLFNSIKEYINKK
jgi:hypothetical protein